MICFKISQFEAGTQVHKYSDTYLPDKVPEKET